MKELLENILSECSRYTREGTVATYIPELAKAYRDALGIFVITNDGKHHFAGDYEKPFTLQSVVKPVILLLALEDRRGIRQPTLRS